MESAGSVTSDRECTGCTAITDCISLHCTTATDSTCTSCTEGLFPSDDGLTCTGGSFGCEGDLDCDEIPDADDCDADGDGYGTCTVVYGTLTLVLNDTYGDGWDGGHYGWGLYRVYN